MAINYDNFVVKPGEKTRCVQCPVRKLALFKGVSLENLEWTQGYREQQFVIKPKRRLVEEGISNPYAFTLFSGWAALYQTSTVGNRQIHRFALPGDFIGFRPNLDIPIHYSAQTLTEVTVCAFPIDRLGWILRQRTDLSARMMELNAQSMRLCQQYMLGIGRKSAKERLSFLFMELFYRAKSLAGLLADTRENSIAFPISQEDMADAMGLTSVHVSRTLKELTDAGLLTVKNRRLTIHNESALAELAQFDKKLMPFDHPLL